MDKKFVIVGSAFGAISVILGALASHWLKGQLSAESLASFQTGVRYQMYHSILMIVLPSLEKWIQDKQKLIFNLLVFGIFFFCWSIFLLTTGPILGLKLNFLGPVTPLGGICLISAWIIIFFQAIKN